MVLVTLYFASPADCRCLYSMPVQCIAPQCRQLNLACRHHNYFANGDCGARNQLPRHHQQRGSSHLVHSASAGAWTSAQIHGWVQNPAGFVHGTACDCLGRLGGQQLASQHWVPNPVALTSPPGGVVPTQSRTGAESCWLHSRDSWSIFLWSTTCTPASIGHPTGGSDLTQGLHLEECVCTQSQTAAGLGWPVYRGRFSLLWLLQG